MNLESRIARLEAIEEIKALKAWYCAYCDDGYRPDELAGLFTRAGAIDAGPFGRHVGRKAIRDYFAAISKTLVYAAHHATNPIIEVDGAEATGRWRLHVAATMIREGRKEAVWIVGDYRDTYAVEDGKWRFADVALAIDFIAPHATGWPA
ncbi:MAG: nuclear transport factor 2 family protein [Alphaproteobacteria bacterium]|nr:nuclear transport factor 2 family protein [Alphaproteobacteria bacterium]